MTQEAVWRKMEDGRDKQSRPSESLIQGVSPDQGSNQFWTPCRLSGSLTRGQYGGATRPLGYPRTNAHNRPATAGSRAALQARPAQTPTDTAETAIRSIRGEANLTQRPRLALSQVPVGRRAAQRQRQSPFQRRRNGGNGRRHRIRVELPLGLHLLP